MTKLAGNLRVLARLGSGTRNKLRAWNNARDKRACKGAQTVKGPGLRRAAEVLAENEKGLR